MFELTIGGFQVVKIHILRQRSGADRITFELDKSCPSPFPKMSKGEPGMYPPIFSVETQRGYAESWIKTMFGDLPEGTVTVTEAKGG